MSSRRNFIQKTALGLAGSAVIPFIGKTGMAQPGEHANEKAPSALAVGVAGYTFAKFDLDQSIAMMKRLGVQNLSVKDIHLPLNSSEEKIRSAMAKFKDAG